MSLCEEQKDTEWPLLRHMQNEGECLCKVETECLVLVFADVHNAEFVLTGVLTQTLDYESYPFCINTVCCFGKCGLLKGVSLN